MARIDDDELRFDHDLRARLIEFLDEFLVESVHARFGDDDQRIGVDIARNARAAQQLTIGRCGRLGIGCGRGSLFRRDGDGGWCRQFGTTRGAWHLVRAGYRVIACGTNASIGGHDVAIRLRAGIGERVGFDRPKRFQQFLHRQVFDLVEANGALWSRQRHIAHLTQLFDLFVNRLRRGDNHYVLDVVGDRPILAFTGPVDEQCAHELVDLGGADVGELVGFRDQAQRLIE